MIVKNEPKQELVFEESDVLSKTCVPNNGPHGPLVTDSTRGEILCGRCGLVLADKVEDLGPEQRSFSAEQYSERSRTGMGSALSIHDKGLSTIIGTTNKDAAGHPLSSSVKYTFNRLRTWDSRSRATNEETNLRSAFIILGSIQSKLELSEAVIERAAYLYRKALTKNITRGRTISGTILSALYVSCRESNIPRTLHDIAQAGNISVKDLSRHYRTFVNALGLQIESFDSSDFVSKIGTAVGLSERAKRDALNILHHCKEKHITDGKNPVSLAASALFLAGILNNEVATQKRLSEIAGVSSVTIRNVSKVMKKSLGNKKV